MQTDNITNFIGELDAGAFQRRVAACLAEVAKGISLTDKPGEITLSFKIKPAKNSNQTGAGVRVGVTSKISYTRPTHQGKLSEDNTTETPMWINKDHSISLSAASHDDMFGEGSPGKVSALNGPR